MSHDSVEGMMQDFATAAVAMGKELGVKLDFSEESLHAVESILERLHRELRDSQIASSATSSLQGEQAAKVPQASLPSPDQMDDMCKLWGSYFGEVVRRRWGGEWSIETYPGAKFATLVLTLQAGKLFPSIKVFRRLTEGDSDNIWTFYESVKKRLQQQPGSAVQ